jgi:hypothetical protein
MWQRRMAAFLRGKVQILWDVTVNIDYVHPMNFLAPGSRDMFDTNNKADDYLYRSLCESEFERVRDEDTTSTSTPAAPSPTPAPAARPSAPPSGPITQARAREFNFVMMLKNEGPKD